MRLVPWGLAICVCLGVAGCHLTGKKAAGGKGSSPAGADAPNLRADRGPPTPTDRSLPPPGVNGMLAGQVIDGANRRIPASFIDVTEAGDGSGISAPITVPADRQGYFTIQGLQVGRRYVLTARSRNGSQESVGRAMATAPDSRVVIRLSENRAAPFPGPQPSQGAGPPPPRWPDGPSKAGQPAPRRAAELGPPVGLNAAPDGPGTSSSPGPTRPGLDFRPDKTAQGGMVRNDSPEVNWNWAPTPPPLPRSNPPAEPAFGPARVPSCVLTGDTLYNFALNDVSGQPWEYRSHRGRIVLIDFWATWCIPCLQAIPHLVDLQGRYGPYGLEVVGIANEQGTPAEQAAKVRRVQQRLRMNYRVLLSGDSADSPCPVRRQFAASQLPTLVLLNEQGRIIWRSEGLTRPQLRELEIIIRQQLGIR